MNWKNILGVVLGVVLVLGAIALWNPVAVESPTGNVVLSQCSDSDGGIDSEEYGNVIFGEIMKNDSCLNNDTLIEWYCLSEGKVARDLIDCDLGCSYGECLPSSGEGNGSGGSGSVDNSVGCEMISLETPILNFTEDNENYSVTSYYSLDNKEGSYVCNLVNKKCAGVFELYDAQTFELNDTSEEPFGDVLSRYNKLNILGKDSCWMSFGEDYSMGVKLIDYSGGKITYDSQYVEGFLCC